MWRDECFLVLGVRDLLKESQHCWAHFVVTQGTPVLCREAVAAGSDEAVFETPDQPPFIPGVCEHSGSVFTLLSSHV